MIANVGELMITDRHSLRVSTEAVKEEDEFFFASPRGSRSIKNDHQYCNTPMAPR